MEERMLRFKYWNANGFAVAIVAREGGAKDYAAYIGATEGLTLTDRETVDFVLKHGCKIDQEHAEALFPVFKEAGLAYRH